MTQEEQLLNLCKTFIATRQISCPETIYQTDHVIENACTFIEDICNIVGYMECDNE